MVQPIILLISNCKESSPMKLISLTTGLSLLASPLMAQVTIQ